MLFGTISTRFHSKLKFYIFCLNNFEQLFLNKCVSDFVYDFSDRIAFIIYIIRLLYTLILIVYKGCSKCELFTSVYYVQAQLIKFLNTLRKVGTSISWISWVIRLFNSSTSACSVRNTRFFKKVVMSGHW